MRNLALLALSALLLGCSSANDTGSDTDDTTDTDVAGSGMGRLVLRFTIDADLADAMAEPPVGTVHGDLFRAEDINNLGPIGDAEAVGSFRSEAVDITPDGHTDTVSTVSFTSELLLVGFYRAAGFLDSDDNGDETSDPDAGDPVTFPANNEFEVLSDQDVDAVIEFNLLYPTGR